MVPMHKAGRLFSLNFMVLNPRSWIVALNSEEGDCWLMTNLRWRYYIDVELQLHARCFLAENWISSVQRYRRTAADAVLFSVVILS